MGLESFVEFVYDLGESTMLSEARAGGVRVEPVTKGGKAVGSLKGGPKAAAIKRLRKEKQARRDAESGSSKPSGMKAALKSQSDSCLLYTSPSPRDRTRSRMPSSA